jgi:hypothetical protein
MLRIIEPAARALRDELQTNLPTALNALEAAIGGGVVLPDPVEYTLGRKANHGAYPVIEVDTINRGTRMDDEAGMKWEARLAIICIVTAQNLEEALALMVWRYEAAIIQCLMDRRSAGAFSALGLGLNLQSENVDYSDAVQIGGDIPQFMRGLFIPVLMERTETRA